MQERVDDKVADETLNAKTLPVMGIELLVNRFVIWNDVVITAGAVKKKVNVDPPLAVDNVTTPAPEGPYVGTEKSMLNAVVAPDAVRTFTVQLMISLMRTTVVDPLVWPMQDKIEEVEGIP